MNEEDLEQLAKKMQKGKFDMEDLKKQLNNLKKMGGISSIMGMLPGFKGIKQALGSDKFDKSVIIRQEAIIDSMTKKEKMYPKIMNASRKNRVAKGAGVTVQDINKLLKQFLEMQKMMKKVSNLDERNLRKFENMIDNKYKNNIS